MKIVRTPKALANILVAAAILFGACGPTEDAKEEAYSAGWNSAVDERCKKIEPPLMMPSKYDDSKDSGELVQAYRSGIADAKADSTLCK